MEIRVREAILEDYDGLCEVLAEVDEYHARAMPNIFRMYEGPARPREYVESAIADEDSALLVADSEGLIVGALWAVLRQASPFEILVPRRYIVIEEVAVRKSFRSRGIGQALMERAEEWAASKGVSELELNVWEFNRRAIAFYERLGYETMSRRMWKSAPHPRPLSQKDTGASEDKT